MASAPNSELQSLLTLAQLESMARQASSPKELHFVVVNETRRLLSYRQAILVALPRGASGPARVEAASSVSTVDPHAPMIRWVQRAVREVLARDDGPAPVRVSRSGLSPALREDAAEFAPACVLVCPLRPPGGHTVGAIWLARETPWGDHDLTLAGRLSDTYAHAWSALVGARRLRDRGWPRRALAVAVATLLVAALFVHVPLTTLAPTEVVARDPGVISAPMDGVIGEVLVPPNATVAAGQAVMAFEDTQLRNQRDVAEKALAVAEAEHRTAAQRAFVDPARNAEIAFLEARVDLSRAERDYAKELLDQVVVRAPSDGLLLYSDEQDWIGRPVSVGERIMEIADPARVALRIDLPVGDAIVLRKGARVQAFLDVDPLHAREARIEHFSYHAAPTAADVLSFRVSADFVDPAPGVRIGLRGTAKIHGESVALGFLLFRRPISALRQIVGL